MFELYNEPGWFPWATWRSLAQNIVDEIRKKSNNIVLVSGVRTAYYVKEVPTNPVTGSNIAYSTHCYADSTLYSDSWDTVMKPAAQVSPVVMTEWGIAIWTEGMFLNDSLVHSYLHLLPYYMRDNGWDGMFAWNWDQSLGGTPLVYSDGPLFEYTDWGEYARNVMIGNMPPYADIGVSGSQNTSSTLQFYDNLGWGVSSWDWDFGDGTSHGVGRNVTHVYGAPGAYMVTLTATNTSYDDTGLGPDVTTLEITITGSKTSKPAGGACLFIGLIVDVAGSVYNFFGSLIS
jgi:hypothetical protein